MRIGLNAKLLSTPKPAGPEMYAKKLYRALAQLDKKNTYTLYFDTEPNPELLKFITCGNPKFSYKVLPKCISWTQISLAWELFAHPVDVFFTPMHTLPGLMTILTLGKFKAVTMIHGLEYKTNKDFVGKPLHKLMHPFVLWWTATFSKALVVPSEATKQAILNDKLLPIPAEKIHITPEGVEQAFFDVPAEEVARAQRKFNVIDTPYLLFIGTIQPRKNIPNMVQAFAEARAQGKLTGTKLLMSGKPGWNFQESLDAPKKYNVANDVIFLNWVADADLRPLLAGAKGYVNFSVEEGFGLTLIEAFAAEVPTAVSDVAAYKELGQDYPIYADPHNVESIKQALITLTENKTLDTKGAREHARKYTWQESAGKILNCLQLLTQSSKTCK